MGAFRLGFLLQEIKQQMARATGWGGAAAILAESQRRGIPTFRVDSAEDLMIGMTR
jgi:hypothetical protein